MLEGLKRLLGLTGQQKGKLISSCVFSVVGTAFGLIPFILVYFVMLELFKPVINQAYVWKLAVLIIVSVVLRFAFMGISGSLSHLAAYSIGNSLDTYSYSLPYPWSRFQ